VIQTNLEIGNSRWPIETLTNRDSMIQMLLGREAMSGRVLVDPEQTHLLVNQQQTILKIYEIQ
jgi:ribosomal protein S6--L-glutamate ligase